MDDSTTYSARIYKTEIYRGTEVTTHWVRWKVGGKMWKEPFRNAAQADSFRSSLLTAARKGEAFSINTGRPLAWDRDQPSVSWYALTLAYTAAKWPYASPNHRRGIAEALTDATEAMLAVDGGPPTRDEIRRALRAWAFSERLSGTTSHPTTWPPSPLAGSRDHPGGRARAARTGGARTARCWTASAGSRTAAPRPPTPRTANGWCWATRCSTPARPAPFRSTQSSGEVDQAAHAQDRRPSHRGQQRPGPQAAGGRPRAG